MRRFAAQLRWQLGIPRRVPHLKDETIQHTLEAVLASAANFAEAN